MQPKLAPVERVNLQQFGLANGSYRVKVVEHENEMDVTVEAVDNESAARSVFLSYFPIQFYFLYSCVNGQPSTRLGPKTNHADREVEGDTEASSNLSAGCFRRYVLKTTADRIAEALGCRAADLREGKSRSSARRWWNQVWQRSPARFAECCDLTLLYHFNFKSCACKLRASGPWRARVGLRTPSGRSHASARVSSRSQGCWARTA